VVNLIWAIGATPNLLRPVLDDYKTHSQTKCLSPPEQSESLSPSILRKRDKSTQQKWEMEAAVEHVLVDFKSDICKLIVIKTFDNPPLSYLKLLYF